MSLNLKSFFQPTRPRRTYAFRIHNPPPRKAVDDLVGGHLAAISVFIVADKPTAEDYLFVVTTNNESVEASQILEILNDQFELSAELLEEGEEG
jgi:hypothetical protein